ncbi:tRNA 2-selenouridine(34) synthase MnmH [Aliiruegeria sabulilitoris]|uniref:tRNA 2-selenouridine(34) synthase MnmH n=1 Tax=Aliiruegeria sabulilitoris TaxID=1510458 RepID=UPI0008375136|nr:tRNA 2-selenouridine(34) synthase MnmH [Aliiruegeria sabulilitoris]NDR56769.1 tRNA 2-selenouridine(34) synthase MnmH [Pseudoruegeria sp. M32A2M]
MAYELPDLSAPLEMPFDDVIDVRSPDEFAEDHLPGAISLPVLDNEQRAIVGTIYKQESPFKARKVGAALVAQNAARHLQGPLADKDGAWQPLVYCWRGGQRSNSLASIFKQVGWRADVLTGGYQTYRRAVVARLYENVLPHRFVLIDGDTGTAKTEILHLVAARGGQILDLEGLANHRGSVLGPRPGGQPSQKMLESRLVAALARLDPARPVLVEAESSKVGDLLVPPTVWQAMRAAPRVRVQASVEDRAKYLARAYADISADRDGLKDILSLLVRLQGHERVNGWKEMVDQGQFEALALDLVTLHYDSRYAKSRSVAGEPAVRMDIALSAEGLGSAADRVLEAVETLRGAGSQNGQESRPLD